MRRSYVVQLLVFVGLLILLNLFFHLHISIIGSLLLTIVLSVVMNFFSRS